MADKIQHRFGTAPELLRSGGGVFEITVNEKLVYSKKSTGRFPEDAEVFRLIEQAN